jgi:hypothetical protein
MSGLDLTSRTPLGSSLLDSSLSTTAEDSTNQSASINISSGNNSLNDSDLNGAFNDSMHSDSLHTPAIRTPAIPFSAHTPSVLFHTPSLDMSAPMPTSRLFATPSSHEQKPISPSAQSGVLHMNHQISQEHTDRTYHHQRHHGDDHDQPSFNRHEDASQSHAEKSSNNRLFFAENTSDKARFDRSRAYVNHAPATAYLTSASTPISSHKRTLQPSLSPAFSTQQTCTTPYHSSSNSANNLSTGESSHGSCSVNRAEYSSPRILPHNPSSAELTRSSSSASKGEYSSPRMFPNNPSAAELNNSSSSALKGEYSSPRMLPNPSTAQLLGHNSPRVFPNNQNSTELSHNSPRMFANSSANTCVESVNASFSSSSFLQQYTSPAFQTPSRPSSNPSLSLTTKSSSSGLNPSSSSSSSSPVSFAAQSPGFQTPSHGYNMPLNNTASNAYSTPANTMPQNPHQAPMCKGAVHSTCSLTATNSSFFTPNSDQQPNAYHTHTARADITCTPATSSPLFTPASHRHTNSSRFAPDNESSLFTSCTFSTAPPSTANSPHNGHMQTAHVSDSMDSTTARAASNCHTAMHQGAMSSPNMHYAARTAAPSIHGMSHNGGMASPDMQYMAPTGAISKFQIMCTTPSSAAGTPFCETGSSSPMRASLLDFDTNNNKENPDEITAAAAYRNSKELHTTGQTGCSSPSMQPYGTPSHLAPKSAEMLQAATTSSDMQATKGPPSGQGFAVGSFRNVPTRHYTIDDMC